MLQIRSVTLIIVTTNSIVCCDQQYTLRRGQTVFCHHCGTVYCYLIYI